MLKSFDYCMCSWLGQARREFTQGAQEHLMVTGVDCADLVQEGLQALEQEMNSWVEQLRQTKVLLQTLAISLSCAMMVD